MNLLITLLLKNGQLRTMQHYKATLNSYMRFRNDKDITLQEIDAEEIQSYEAYLKNVAKVCSNTNCKNGTTPKSLDRYISAPSKAQKWMKPMPESWHRYDLKK